MSQRVDYFWRLIATGAAFAFIFFGGGVLALVMLPTYLVRPASRQKWVRMIIRTAFRFYIGMLQRLGLLSLEVIDRERLEGSQGRIIVANHPSLLDVVLLIAPIPRAQCIIKHELWSHALLGGLMRSAGFIRNDLEPETFVQRCGESLASGDSLIIFPEGTRSIPGTLPRFQRGFANLATLTHARVQPIFITCDPPTLLKGEPWWRVPARKPLFRITVDLCLDESLYLGYRYRSIAVRKLVTLLHAHYAEKLRAPMGDPLVET